MRSARTATSAPSATTTSPSTAGAAPKCGTCVDFQRDFAEVRLVRLEENYRSTQVVLDAANAVIAENTGRIGKTLRTARRGGESVTLVAAADERDEAEWIVGRAAPTLRRRRLELRRDGRALPHQRAVARARRGVPPGGIPYRIVGAISFYDRREVKDLLAYLRLVANPADNEAFLRAVLVPRRGIGESSLAAVIEAAGQWGKPLLATAAHRRPAQRPPAERAAGAHRVRRIDRATPEPVGAPAARRSPRGADPGHRLREPPPTGRARGRRPLGERAGTGGERGQLVGGRLRRSRGGRHAAGAVPGRRRAPQLPRCDRGLGGGRHPDDDSHRQGAGVAGRGARRARGRPLPAVAGGRAAGRRRGGAAALLRRADPRQGQALRDLRAEPPPWRNTAVLPPVAVPGGVAARNPG